VRTGFEEGERLADRWRRLERETLAEAQAAVARRRRFRCLGFARAPLAFLRTLLVERSFLDGTPGLIRAGMNAIHSFVARLRTWSLERDAERAGEPHEHRPIVERNGSCTALVCPAWHERLAGIDLYTAALNAPRAPKLAGRGDLGLLELDGARLLCKPMQHGGLLAKLLGGRYLDARKPCNELRVVGHALARGVPTAEIAAMVTKRDLWPVYRYWVFSSELAGTVDLRAYLRASPPRAERMMAIAAIARAVRTMHDAGILHADLHLKNILVRVTDRTRPEAFIIDFDKARVRPRLDVRQRFGNLARLWRSAEKARAAGVRVRYADMIAFLRTYAGDTFRLYLDLVRGYRRIRRHRRRYARRLAEQLNP
jgi:tRNA A-37 threonylcarbamoyl transferase component Bud32